MIFFVLAFFSLPAQGLDWFTPETTTTCEFTVYRTLYRITTTTATYPNGTVVKSTTTTMIQLTNATGAALGGGFVTLKSKGGLSAGNPISIDITLYTNKDAKGGEPSNVTVTPQGAFAANILSLGPFPLPFAPIVPQTDQLGFPLALSIALTRQGNKWSGSGIVIYNQGGAMGLDFDVDNLVAHVADVFQIGSEAVTVTARTNSLLISLTWVIIAFSALEVKLEDNGCQPKKE